MVRISTFVFFDIETTGLPYQEKNQTKITELSLVAVTRNDIKRHRGTVPPNSKLTFVLNPQKTIHPAAAAITGLSNDMLKYSPTFEQKFNTLNYFLEGLSKPICLVAHNGNTFDYPILLAECADADVKLPEDLLCADSLLGFKKLLKDKTVLEQSMLTTASDDENEWPDLDITTEELHNIDELCSSLSDMSCDSFVQNKVPKKKTKKVKVMKKKERESYKLVDVYRKLLNVTSENAHRAEDDCLMLLKCVGACQSTDNTSEDFLRWIDNNCKNLNEIVPLKRK